MHFDGTILTITSSEINKKYGLSIDFIKTALYKNRKGISNSWAHTTDLFDKRVKHIDFDSIPEQTKKKYKLPSKETLIEQWKKQKLIESVSAKESDITYFQNNPLTKSKAREYALLAAWCEYLAPYSVKTARLMGFKDLTDLYSEAIRQISETHKITVRAFNNTRVFKRYLKPFQEYLNGDIKREDALNTLPNRRNKVRRAYKLTNDAKKLLFSMYINKNSTVKKLIDDVYQDYNAICSGKKALVDIETGEYFCEKIDKAQLKELSYESIRSYLMAPAQQAIASKFRDGKKYHNDRFRPYIHGTKPKFSLSLTSADGETIPFYLIINNRLTWKRATCYMIYDVMSECLIGMAIGAEENKELMKAAYKDMLLFTGGLAPLDNQLDNFGQSFKTELQEIFPNVHFCLPDNPQSKYAENYIGRWEDDHLRHIEGWTFKNIQSKQQWNKQNPDTDRLGYTLDQLNDMYTLIREAWNNEVPKWSKKGLTRMEMYSQNINPECAQLDNHLLARYAGESTKRKITRGFVPLEYQGEKYEYYIPDYGPKLSKFSQERVEINFLPDNMDTVWIHDIKTGKLLAECPSIDKTQRAPVEKTVEDIESHADQARRVHQFDRWVDDQAAEINPIKVIDTEMSVQEAEGILARGYTEKHLMQKAEAIVGQRDREMRAERFADKKLQKEKKKASEEAQKSRFEIDPESETTTKRDLSDIRRF